MGSNLIMITGDIVFFILVWSSCGFFISMITFDLSLHVNTAQSIFLHIIGGPIMWLYGIWRILGLFGKR